MFRPIAIAAQGGHDCDRFLFAAEDHASCGYWHLDFLLYDQRFLDGDGGLSQSCPDDEATADKQYQHHELPIACLSPKFAVVLDGHDNVVAAGGGDDGVIFAALGQD